MQPYQEKRCTATNIFVYTYVYIRLLQSRHLWWHNQDATWKKYKYSKEYSDSRRQDGAKVAVACNSQANRKTMHSNQQAVIELDN